MSGLLDTLLVLLLLTNLLILGTSGLPSAIRIVAGQGVLLGCLARVGAWQRVPVEYNGADLSRRPRLEESRPACASAARHGDACVYPSTWPLNALAATRSSSGPCEAMPCSTN